MKKHLLVVYIVILFNVFYLTPLFLVADISLQLFAFFGIFSIIRYKYLSRRPHRYIIMLLGSMVIISIGSSIINLGQDIFSAMVATRDLLKGFSIFFFLPFIERGEVNLQKTLSSILRFSWLFACFVAIVSMLRWTYIFVSPLSEVPLEVTGAKYDKSIIFFAIIYYLIHYFRDNHLRSLIFAFILFITTQLYDIQRGDFIFMGLILMIIFLKYRNSVSSRKLILISPLIAILLIFGVSSIDTSIFQQKFQQMFLLLDSDAYETIEDASIFVRIKEADLALTGFNDSPIFGNGLIRASKKEALIGDVYFYPADVGLLGVMYTYGIYGLVVFIFSLVYLAKQTKKKFGFLQYLFFINSVYIVAYSFKDGTLIFYPSLFIFCILMISVLEGAAFRHQYIIKRSLLKISSAKETLL